MALVLHTIALVVGLIVGLGLGKLLAPILYDDHESKAYTDGFFTGYLVACEDNSNMTHEEAVAAMKESAKRRWGSFEPNEQ